MIKRLFTIGPVQMYDSTLEVRSKQIPYFRNNEFSDIMKENETLLKKFQSADDNSRVVFLTASGTGAMEASIINLFNEDDRVLVISGGTFGERFERICEAYGIPFDVLKVGYDSNLTISSFRNFNPKNYTGLLVNIHETSIGKLYDINVIRDFCKKGDMLLVVDAISSFLCDDYKMSKYGVDVSITSSQKGLCLAPGMSFVTLSGKAQEKLNKINYKGLYFNFVDYIRNMERGQTPFTPAVGICYELNDMLKKIDNDGVPKMVFNCCFNARYFRELLKDLNVKIPTFSKSNAITSVSLNRPNASKILTTLYNKYDIVLNPSSGDLNSNSFRVSHVGNIDANDYKKIVRVIKSYSK